MNVSIAEKQNRRARVVYSELLHLIAIAEYMRKHDPDYDYLELFKNLKKIINN